MPDNGLLTSFLDAVSREIDAFVASAKGGPSTRLSESHPSPANQASRTVPVKSREGNLKLNTKPTSLPGNVVAHQTPRSGRSMPGALFPRSPTPPPLGSAYSSPLVRFSHRSRSQRTSKTPPQGSRTRSPSVLEIPPPHHIKQEEEQILDSDPGPSCIRPLPVPPPTTSRNEVGETASGTKAMVSVSRLPPTDLHNPPARSPMSSPSTHDGVSSNPPSRRSHKGKKKQVYTETSPFLLSSLPHLPNSRSRSRPTSQAIAGPILHTEFPPFSPVSDEPLQESGLISSSRQSYPRSNQDYSESPHVVYEHPTSHLIQPVTDVDVPVESVSTSAATSTAEAEVARRRILSLEEEVLRLRTELARRPRVDEGRNSPNGVGEVYPPPPPPPPPPPLGGSRIPNSGASDALLSSIRAGLKHQHVPVVSDPQPHKISLQKKASATLHPIVPADQMDAFLSELKSARLRKVARINPNGIGDRSGARDPDESFPSMGSSSFTSDSGSGSGSGESFFSSSFSLGQSALSSRGTRPQGPAPPPADFLRSRLRKVHSDGIDGISSKSGTRISRPTIISSNRHASGLVSESGGNTTFPRRDSGTGSLRNEAPGTMERPTTLHVRGHSKKDIVDLTMDDTGEATDVENMGMFSHARNGRLKRKQPEGSQGETFGIEPSAKRRSVGPSVSTSSGQTIRRPQSQSQSLPPSRPDPYADTRSSRSLESSITATPSLISDVGDSRASTAGHSEPPLPSPVSRDECHITATELGSQDAFADMISLQELDGRTDMHGSFNRFNSVPTLDFRRMNKLGGDGTFARTEGSRNYSSPQNNPVASTITHTLPQSTSNLAPATASTTQIPKLSQTGPPSVHSGQDAPTRSRPHHRPPQASSLFDTQARTASSPLPATPRKPQPPSGIRRKKTSTPLARKNEISRIPLQVKCEDSTDGASLLNGSLHPRNDSARGDEADPESKASHPRSTDEIGAEARLGFTLDEEMRRVGASLDIAVTWGDLLENEEYTGTGQHSPGAGTFMKGGGAGGCVVRSAF